MEIREARGGTSLLPFYILRAPWLLSRLDGYCVTPAYLLMAIFPLPTTCSIPRDQLVKDSRYLVCIFPCSISSSDSVPYFPSEAKTSERALFWWHPNVLLQAGEDIIQSSTEVGLETGVRMLICRLPWLLFTVG